MSDPDFYDLINGITELSKGLDAPIDLGTPQNMIGGSSTPPDAPPAMGKTTEGTSQEGAGKMETLGYMYLDGLPPDPSNVADIMRTFDEGVKIEEGPTTHIQGGSVCFNFLESGIGESLMGIAQRELGTGFVISQGPVILGHNPSATELGPKFAHARRGDGMSFIRLVHGSMNVERDNDTVDRDAFVIYASSHSADYFDENQAHRPAAEPNRLFILRGALRWKIRPPEGCVLVWVGFSTVPTGAEKRRDVSFPFMVNYQRVQLPEPGSRVGRVKYRDYTKKEVDTIV